jgi:hypothetical protein
MEEALVDRVDHSQSILTSSGKYEERRRFKSSRGHRLAAIVFYFYSEPSQVVALKTGAAKLKPLDSL